MFQAFINTAAKIYQKIEEGIFDVSNEVRVPHCKQALVNHSFHLISNPK
jgi:hypothetical protein